jgi:hypothetical protein
MRKSGGSFLVFCTLHCTAQGIHLYTHCTDEAMKETAAAAGLLYDHARRHSGAEDSRDPSFNTV